MNAASVHGGGDVLARISLRFGLRGQYGPWAPICGIATESGRDAGEWSSEDIASSSSASQSSVMCEGGFFREELVEDEVVEEEVEEVKLDEGFLAIIT